VNFILRDLTRLPALDDLLESRGLALPGVSRVGLHSDTSALKFVITRASEHARIQAEAAAAPMGAKLGAVTELQVNPPAPYPRQSSCGMPSQEEMVLDYYGYDKPPTAQTRLQKVRLRGLVSAIWALE
jgi:hypothetical protein